MRLTHIPATPYTLTDHKDRGYPFPHPVQPRFPVFAAVLLCGLALLAAILFCLSLSRMM